MNDDFSIAKGWIKAYRYWLDDPIIMKNSDNFAMWTYLNLLATHQTRQVEFNGKRHLLNPGELITGRKSISRKLKMDESKVQRILKRFTDEGLISQRTTNKNRLIRINSWDNDQISEHQNGQQKIPGTVMKKEVLDDSTKPDKQPDGQQDKKIRTTIEQQSNTNKNYKNIKNVEEAVDKRTSHLKQVNECFKAWGIKPKGDEKRITENLLREYGYNLVRKAFEIATFRNVKKLDYVKGIIEEENKKIANEEAMQIRDEAREKGICPSLKEVEEFFIQQGSESELAKSFYVEQSTNKWITFDKGYIGYGDDWKIKAALRCGIIYSRKYN